MTREERDELRTQIRKALEPYRGDRFEVGDSGGARGMIFRIDPDGAQWFIGGLHDQHSQAFVAVLNATLRLLE